MEKVFKDLGNVRAEGNGGKDPIETGFEKMSKIQNVLEKAKLNTISPPLDSSNFFKLIESKGDSIEDISTFMDMILTRNSRKFATIIQEMKRDDATLGDAIHTAFSQTHFKDKEDQVMNIFREVVSRDNYKKNSTAMGKAEIAMALFFGDCTIPDDHGDIQFND